MELSASFTWPLFVAWNIAKIDNGSRSLERDLVGHLRCSLRELSARGADRRGLVGHGKGEPPARPYPRVLVR